MKTLHVFPGNGWFLSEYVPYENRSYTGPARIGPCPLAETEQQIEFYRKQGAVIDDRRAGSDA